MNKKLAVASIAIVICIILGGFQSTYLFGTQFLDSRIGYHYSLGEPLSWWDCHWSYCKRIVIDHTKVQSDQFNFPVLLYRSSDSDLATYAQDDGDDIVFVDWLNQSKLDHDIEKFDADTGELIVWVELNEIYSSFDTILYMYYGNPDCSSQEIKGDAWEIPYKMAHHFSEDSGVHFDSTVNSNDGTAYNGVIQGTSGRTVLNGADAFDGIDDYVDCGTSDSLNLTGSLTLEAWVMDPPLIRPNTPKKDTLQILDKHEEHIVFNSEKTLTTKRTITGPFNSTIVFSCLHSPGVEIHDILFENISIFEKSYSKLSVAPDDLPVENNRQKLPSNLQELPIVSYSRSFVLTKKAADIELVFSVQPWAVLFPGTRISYLVFSPDGTYDYETTTHIDAPLMLDWWNPFSFFLKIYDYFFGEKTTFDESDITNPLVLKSLSEIHSLVEQQGSVRVILKMNESKGDFISQKKNLERQGLLVNAEVSAQGILAGDVDMHLLEYFRKNNAIDMVSIDSSFDILLAESLPLIHWNQTIESYNLTGDGIRICLLDTGVDPSIVPYSYGYDFVDNDDEPFDDHGHGTMVAAVLQRIAPGAEIIVAKVIGSDGTGFTSDVLEGLQYCINQNPDIILFSIGSRCGYTGFCDVDLVTSLCNQAVDQGIFVVAAAGNSGSYSLVAPACGKQVFSVGASTDTDSIAHFSNIHPLLDILAPGQDITTVAGTGSGTSLSAPFVAGAAGLLLEYEPLLTPQAIAYRLKSTGIPLSHQYNESLFLNIPRLDIDALIRNVSTFQPVDYTWWPDSTYIDCDPPTFEVLTTLYGAYYFNAYSSSKWTNPANMVDALLNTGAQTTVTGTLAKLNRNTADNHEDYDIITKVELRVYGNMTTQIGYGRVNLRPDFNGTLGTNQTLNLGASSAYTSYIDITTDGAAPDPWTWDDILNLGCYVYANLFSATVWVGRVDIRVTYLFNSSVTISTPSPANETRNVPLNTDSLSVLIEDIDGDDFGWSIETSPDIGSDGASAGLNGTKTCSVSGLTPNTKYTWWVNATDLGNGTTIRRTYEFTTDPLSLLNCSTDTIFYGSAMNVTFTGYAYASNVSDIVLLIANSTKRLDAVNYTNRGLCIANSSNITVTSYPQKITITIPSNENTTWYAKICDNLSNSDFSVGKWNKTYAGRLTGNDQAFCVVNDSNGNVYVGGTGYNLNKTNSNYDAWLMKFNATTGDRLWNKTYAGRSTGGDYIVSVAVDSTGDVYTAGYGYRLNTTNSGYDWWIMKFDGTTGDRLWNKTYAGRSAGHDYARSVAVDSSDNVYVVGDGQHLNTTTSSYDWWIMKFDGTTGDRLWNKTYAGRSTGADYAYSVVVLSTDDVYVGGYGYRLNSTGSSYDWWIMKFDGDTGDRLINRTFHSGGTRIDYLYSIAVDANDDLYFSGAGQNLKTATSSYDFWIRKFIETTGAQVWNNTYNGGSATSIDYPYSICTDDLNKVYVAGTGQNLNSSSSGYDWWIMMFNKTTGDREWNITFSSGSGTDYARSIKTDAAGNVYIAGYGEDLNKSTTNADWWIKKISYITDNYTVDSTKPSVQFIDPTPANDSHRNYTWANISLSSSDWTQHYAFVDFNHSNVLWLRMDDVNSTGDPQDLSSYGNHGIKQGSATQTISGFYGKAFCFDGNGDWINEPYPSLFDIRSNKSFFVWIKTSTTGKTIASRTTLDDASGDGDVEFSISDNTLDWWHLEDNAHGDIVVTDNTWHHVGFTVNSSTVALFVDGQFDSSTPFSQATSLTNSRNVSIGVQEFDDMGTPAYADYFNGIMDEILIFNRSLSLAEIKSLYNASSYPYMNNFTGLTDGTYTYQGYDPDKGGNWNQTEQRNVTIDTVEPSVQFIDPTPYNDTHRNETWVNISLSTTDINQHYSFVNFNQSNILWMRMDDIEKQYSEVSDDTEDSAYLSGSWFSLGDLEDFYDEDWESYILVMGTGSAYINYTIPDLVINSAVDMVKTSGSGGPIDVYSYSYDSSEYILIDVLTPPDTWYNITIPNECIGDPGQNIRLRFDASGNGDPQLFEESLLWNISSYTVSDTSGYQHHGTSEGSAQQSNNGYYGKSFSFDGIGDYIEISNDDSLDFYAANDYTWTCWVYPTTGNIPLMGTKSGVLSSQGIGIILDDSDAPAGYTRLNVVNNTIYVKTDGIVDIPLNEWSFIAVTYSNGFTTGYYNCQDVVFTIGLTYTDDTTNAFMIGSSYDNFGTYEQSYFTGNMDEVFCFNRVLSLAEIRSLFNASAYQHYSNITSLSDQRYNYTGFAVDRAGNRNQTEQRNVTIDTVKPGISFESPPTPENGTVWDTYVNVSVDSSDTNPHYTFVDFNQSCVLWMRMDDANSSGEGAAVYDFSSYGNDGTAMYNANQTDNGYFGKAFAFDDAGDHIRISDQDIFSFTDGAGNDKPFSMSAWIYPQHTGTQERVIIGKYESTGDHREYRFFFQGDGDKLGINLFTYNDVDSYIGRLTDASAIILNQWQHVIVTYNGSEDNEGINLYINTIELDKTDFSDGAYDGMTNRAEELQIGGIRNSGVYPFEGKIDEVLIFNRVLNISEIQSLYNASLYQYQHNFTDLSYENHTYNSYAVDRAGNINQTETRWRNISQIPIVVTNESTGVEETNATLRGYLVYDGGEPCTVQFGISPSGVTIPIPGIYPVSGGETFNYNREGLDPGVLHTFYAQANNSLYTERGYDKYFLTKPQAPTSFIASEYNQTCINLSWTKGTGANNTLIARKTDSYPTNRNDGTVVYNGTGQWYNDTGLDQKMRYYYRAWSYTTWTFDNGSGTQTLQQWSDWYANGTAATSTLKLLNCSTDTSKYAYNGTVTFNAWVHADVGSSVVLLIANSVYNLYNATYSNHDSCIANSIEVTISSQPQLLTATMPATANTTWYAKVCDDEGRSSYLYENTSAWNKTYNGGYSTGSDILYSIAIDSSGNVYAVGMGTDLNSSTSEQDSWIMKFNGSTGDRLWNKSYSLTTYGEGATSVAVDTNNHVYVVGSAYNLNGTLTAADWYIMRFDATTGIRDWNKTYNGGKSTGSDSAQSVVTDSSNNVYVVGYGENLNGTTGSDWWIMKFDGTTSDRLWNKTYQGGAVSEGDRAYSVSVDTTDDIYVVGYGADLNSSASDIDLWIMKFDGATGDRLWNKTFTSSGAFDWDYLMSSCVDSDNHLYVVGYGLSLAGSLNSAWWVMRFNTLTGLRDWNATYNYGDETNYERPYGVVCGPNNETYIVGQGNGLNGTAGIYGLDWWLKHFSPNLAEDVWQWNLSYDGNKRNDVAYAVQLDNEYNIYIGGYGTNLNSSSSGSDWWIKKFEYITGNFTTITSNKVVIRKAGMYGLEINAPANTLYGMIAGDIYVSASIDTTWHHVALTYDGSTIRLYKDGVLVDSETPILGFEIQSNTNHLRIGQYLSGKIDEVRISNTARSSAWINTTFLNTYDPETFAVFEDQVGILSTWGYRKKITINQSMADATLTNFPLLIYNASDTDLQNYALTDGSDIIFLPASEDWNTGSWRSKLDHEIEKYDSSTGELVAWVRIPTLPSGSDTEIYMYYNNSLCIDDYQNPTEVWDDNYLLVHHLEELDYAHFPTRIFDSTSSENNGENVVGTALDNETGKINSAYDFNNENIFNLSDSLGGTTYLTVEAWVYCHEREDFDNFVVSGQSGTKGSLKNWIFGMDGTAGAQQARIQIMYNSGASNQVVKDTIAVPLNTWTYYAGVWTGDQGRFFRDGKQRAIGSQIPDGPHAINNAEEYHTIGGSYGSDTEDWNLFFNGTLDEIRVSNIERNASWILASYENVYNYSTYITTGSVEIKNVAPTQNSPSPTDGATNQTVNPKLEITVGDINGDAMTVTFRTNTSGSWSDIGSNTSVYNGTYSQIPTTMSDEVTTYYWSVNLTDGTVWTNETYSFTTNDLLRPSGDWIVQFTGIFPPLFGHYNKVDESVTDDDASYVESSQGTVVLRYLQINDSGTLSNSTLNVGLSYETVSKTWTVRPSNGQPWDTTSINNLKIGCYYECAEEEDIYETELFDIDDTIISNLATINSITVTVRAKIVKYGSDVALRLTQAYVTVDYTP